MKSHTLLAVTFAAVLMLLSVASASSAASPTPVTASPFAGAVLAAQVQPQASVSAIVLATTVLAVLVYLTFFPNAFVRLGRLLLLEQGVLFQRINRSDPEKIFVTVYNSYSTAALSNGQGVQWDFTTDADGVGVTRPTARATNGGLAAAGVVAEAIAAGAYGLVQVYGYHSAARVRTVTGGSPAIVPGVPLAINVAGSVFCLESVATHFTGHAIYPMAFSFGSTAGFTTIAKPIFIKAL